MSCQYHAPAGLTLGKNPDTPLIKRLGVPQSQSGRFGDEKSILYLSGFEIRPPARRLVAVRRLRYIGCHPQPVPRVKRPGREVVEVKDE